MIKIGENNNCKYMIIGYHGRKGVKGDPTLIGQTVKHSVYHS